MLMLNELLVTQLVSYSYNTIQNMFDNTQLAAN